MPTPTTLLLFALATFVLVIIPGPNTLYIGTCSAAEGRRSGIASALGVEAGTVVHLLAAAIGLSALVASAPLAYEVLRYAGAAYLIFLGIKTLIRRSRGTESEPTESPAPSVRRAFLDGFTVNLLNPKVILFVLSLMPQFVDPGRGSVAVQTLILGAVMIVVAVPLDLSWAMLASWLGSRLRRIRGRVVERRMRWTSGLIYLALGAIAILVPGVARTR